MSNELIQTTFHVISMIMLIGICVSFYISFYWNMRYIRETKRTLHKTRIWYAFACLLVAVAYTVALVTNFTPKPMEYSLIAGIILRPVLFLLGCSLVSVAKQRYYEERKEQSQINILQELVDRMK